MNRGGILSIWIGFINAIILLAVVSMAVGNSQAQEPEYHSYDSLIQDLFGLQVDHPDIARLITLGTPTHEGRGIVALKISDNVDADENENRVLFLGTHHAREWISLEVAFLLAKHLVENYDSDSEIKSMVNNVEIWIIPVVNPDGHEYSRTVDRLWRKNRRDNGFPCNLFDTGWGVDPNRNYGASTWGTITDPRTWGSCLGDIGQTYRGPDPFSEPETQAIRNLMQDPDFNAVLSYHSFSQLILYPWGYTRDPIPDIADRRLMAEMAKEMERRIEAVPGALDYTAEQSSELYRTSGDLTDWSYETFSIPSFTIELRPCNTCFDPGFKLPEDEILPTWNENEPAALFLIEFFSLKIDTPTASRPAFAGPASDPTKIKVTVKGVWRGKTKDDFTVKIGGEAAEVISATRLPETTATGVQNAYELQVQPPPQPSNSTYDLEVIAGDTSDLKEDAVLYGEETNVDVMLVIDRSGSMAGQKIADAKNAAKQFVDLMVEGDKIGVVSFSSSGTVNYGLTTIAGAVRQDAKNAIDAISAGGQTSIGAGLQKGADELTTKGGPTHPWAMVLLSNGGENRAPFVSDVLPSIVEAGIVVHTIGLGTGTNEALLQDIASQTGGTYHFAPSSQELADIYSQISAAVTGQQTVFSNPGTVQQDATDEQQVTIDSSISETTFSITWGGSDLNLTLETPSGVIIDPAVAAADPDIEFSSSATLEFYRIMSPEVGQWIMQTNGVIIDPPGPELYTARVVAQTQILMDLFLEGGTLTDDLIKVTVSLADTQPIAGATVTVLVEPPSPGSPLSITLHDDGNHGDGLANDGVYANSFADTSIAGSYQFTANASGLSTAGDAFTRENSQSAFVKQRPAITVNVIAPPDVEVAPGTSFVHVFTIENIGGQADTYDLIVGPVEEDQWADPSTIPDNVTVGAGASVQLPITINVPPAERHPSSNLLSLVAISQLEPLVRDSDSVTTSVPHADLFVTITGPETAPLGSSVDYTITYGNQGPAEAVNVVIGVELPPGMEYVEDTLGGSVILPDGSRGWFLTSLASGSQDSFTLTLHIFPTVASDTTLLNTVGIVSGLTDQGVAAGTPDPVPTNNSASASTIAIGIIVPIDIWPFLENNVVIPSKDHPVPVAILSTNTFDAPSEVDITSLTFGRTGDEQSLHRCIQPPVDANDDGLLDRLCHFRSSLTGFQIGDTEGVLRGQTVDGIPIEGRHSVLILPSKETRLFTAHLSGDSEVPPVATSANGRVSLKLHEAETELGFVLQMRNLRRVTAAHIHCGPAGANGPVGVTLFSGGPVTRPILTGKVTAPDAGNLCGWTDLATVVAAMKSGDTYVNVHTVAHPSGEIRGQVQSVDP